MAGATRTSTRRGWVDRLAAAAGVIGPAGFITAWVVGGGRRPHYSAVEDAISRLAADGSPGRSIMTAGFVCFGIGVPLYACLGLRRTVPSRAWLTATATGVATLGVAAFPLDRSTLVDRLHAVAAFAGYATLAATPLLAASALRTSGRTVWARASVAAGVASAAFLTASTLGPHHGLFQRLGLTTVDAWLVASALALTRPPGQTTPAVAHGRDGDQAEGG